ncbi:uncharacterized protein [Primulina eburnea]|uniref:uncharacterized protein isoform X1 n=1 Tax=Primulina eburnea TaxID=1245227 RepID=UPI003C6BD819
MGFSNCCIVSIRLICCSLLDMQNFMMLSLPWKQSLLFRTRLPPFHLIKAVWEAIQSNKAVQDLQGSIFAAKKERLLNCSEEEPDIMALIIRWILKFTRSKLLELAESFGLLVNEMIQSSPKDKPTSELDHLLEEKVRSSLLLSVIIMLIAVISRS